MSNVDDVRRSTEGVVSEEPEEMDAFSLNAEPNNIGGIIQMVLFMEGLLTSLKVPTRIQTE